MTASSHNPTVSEKKDSTDSLVIPVEKIRPNEHFVGVFHKETKAITMMPYIPNVTLTENSEGRFTEGFHTTIKLKHTTPQKRDRVTEKDVVVTKGDALSNELIAHYNTLQHAPRAGVRPNGKNVSAHIYLFERMRVDKQNYENYEGFYVFYDSAKNTGAYNWISSALHSKNYEYLMLPDYQKSVQEQINNAVLKAKLPKPSAPEKSLSDTLSTNNLNRSSLAQINARLGAGDYKNNNSSSASQLRPSAPELDNDQLYGSLKPDSIMNNPEYGSPAQQLNSSSSSGEPKNDNPSAPDFDENNSHEVAFQANDSNAYGSKPPGGLSLN